MTIKEKLLIKNLEKSFGSEKPETKPLHMNLYRESNEAQWKLDSMFVL